MKLSEEIDVDENKRRLWQMLFQSPPPSKKKINISKNAGIVSDIVHQEFKEEEVSVFLESDD